MTPSTKREFVTRNEADSRQLTSEQGRRPTPRENSRARVPGYDHPQALSSQNPNYEAAKAAKIEKLLHHYRDVLDGLRDAKGTDPCSDGCSLDPKDQHLCRRFGCANPGVLAMMSEAWNHPSYQRLEHLLRVMGERFPGLRVALRDRYERFSERIIAVCPKCGFKAPAVMANQEDKQHHVTLTAAGKLYCRKNGILVTFERKHERVPPSSDNPKKVDDALEWLTRHWSGAVELPAAVAEIEAERELRRVA